MVALKLEAANTSKQVLKMEVAVLKKLQGLNLYEIIIIKLPSINFGSYNLSFLRF